jgi:hypothetical protein
MPRYVIKPDRGRDVYVMWSTVVMGIIGVGARADLLGQDVPATAMDAADRDRVSNPDAHDALTQSDWDEVTLLATAYAGETS